MPESRISRADRRSVAMRARVGEELRVARLAAGLSLADVCGATASSTSELSRIERGQAPWVDISTLARDSAVVGLDLWIRTYPEGEPLRDLGHVRLGTAFRSIVASPLAIAAEVGIGDPRDLRAWDLSLTDPAGEHCGVELETRFVDVQAAATPHRSQARGQRVRPSARRRVGYPHQSGRGDGCGGTPQRDVRDR